MSNEKVETIDPTKEVILTLTVGEVTDIANVLANLPYNQVRGLIDKIDKQAEAQLKEPKEEGLE